MPEGVHAAPRASAYSYIRQRMSACVIANIYHFQHPNPLEILFEDSYFWWSLEILILDMSYL